MSRMDDRPNEPMVAYCEWIMDSNPDLLRALVRILVGTSHLAFILDLLLHNRYLPDLSALLVEHYLLIEEYPTSLRCLRAACQSRIGPLIPSVVYFEFQRFSTLRCVASGDRFDFPPHLLHLMSVFTPDEFMLELCSSHHVRYVSSEGGDVVEHLLLIAKTPSKPQVQFAACLLLYKLLPAERLFFELCTIDSFCISAFWLRYCVYHQESASPLLEPLFIDSTALPHARILAAAAKLFLKQDVDRQVLASIPGYPLPWTGALPIPHELRQALLAEWADGEYARCGTDFRLMVEGTLARQGRADPAAPRFSRFSKYYESVDLHIFGPKSIGGAQGSLRGSYHYYYTWFKNGAGQVKTYNLFVVTGAKFGRLKISRWHDNKGFKQFLKKNPIEIPTQEQVQVRLAQWATETLSIRLLSKEELYMRFEGLRVYWGGEDAPLLKGLTFWVTS